MPERGRGWLSPRVVLPALGLVLVVTVLLTPDSGTRAGDDRLTSYSTDARGARGLYELSARLGWRVERRTEPFAGPLDTSATYAVLDPPEPLTPGEVHVVLDAVRRGAGLFAVTGGESPLSDSLKLRRSGGGTQLLQPADSATACGDSDEEGAGSLFQRASGWLDGNVHLWGLRPTAPYPADTVVFVSIRAPAARRGGAPAGPRNPGPASEPAAIGRRLGQGRVVAVSDPDLLRNDVLRVCRWNAGVRAVRMLEWLGSAGSVGGAGARRLVFDEYHQGYGVQPSTTRAVGRVLFGHPAGRTLAQAIAAALVLLVALGARPIAPRAPARIERRSPLEHVGALSRAYEQIGATRLATRRLIRGLRRRHALGMWRRGSDEEFLRSLPARRPDLAADVALLLAAAERKTTPTEFLRVGEAVERIETALR